MERSFASLLQREIRRQKLSIREVARRTDPKDPERGRRRVRRHLNGTVPTAKWRQAYAKALDAPELAGEPTDPADVLVKLIRDNGPRLRRELQGTE